MMKSLMNPIPLIISHLFILGTVLAANGQACLPSVKQFGFFEIQLTNGKDYIDPYRDTLLEVSFISPDGEKIDHWGFYDGDHTWKIRFRPEVAGKWQFKARFSDGQSGKEGYFQCLKKNTGRPPVRVSTINPIWFDRAGEQFPVRALHIGDRFFAGNWPDEDRHRFLDWVQDQGYNMLSIASHYLNRDEETRGRGWDTPKLWPLNAAEYRKMERILDMLYERDIVVFPFAGFFGKHGHYPTDPTEQELYVRYTMARIGHYPNMLYNVAGPEPDMKQYIYFTVPQVAELGSMIRKFDIYDHPLTVHNRTGDDPHKDSEWSSFGTLQGPKTVDRRKLSEGLLKNHHPAKPLFAQETLWSNNNVHIRNIGHDYTNDDLRKNAYVIKMSGAGLCFADNNGNSSSGFSGSLNLNDRNQERHDIIKRVWDFFDTIPWLTMSPGQDLVDNGYCLTEPGKQVLVYLDKTAPVQVKLDKGTYQVEWINASNPDDRRNSGTIVDGSTLIPPAGADDWLLSLKCVN